MPTITEFDLAAAAFDRAGEDLTSLVGSCRRYLGQDVVTGGALAELVEVTMDVSDQNLARASAALSDLAAICRHRSEVSRSYAMDVYAYHRQLEGWRTGTSAIPTGEALPPRPQPPSRPPSWVST